MESSLEQSSNGEEIASLAEDVDLATPNKPNISGKRTRNEADDNNDEGDEQAEPEGTSIKRTKLDTPAMNGKSSGRAKHEGEQDNGGKTSSSEQKDKKDKTTASALAAAVSPALTRSRASGKKSVRETSESHDATSMEEEALASEDDASNKSESGESETKDLRPNKRWRGKSISDPTVDIVANITSKLAYKSLSMTSKVHQMAEDYVHFVGKMMYPATRLRPYGFDSTLREYPIEGISPLGYLKSPLRRPSIIERWSPYEIAVFESALLHHGKEFHLVSREIKTKSTKEVIDFYYVWKKTAHYKKWKEQFIADIDLSDSDDE